MKTFVSVAQTKSFRLSAERNNITQPAVSQHVRILEQKLNCTLLERKGKNINLTEAGKIFYNYAEKILKDYEEAQTRINEIDNNYSGTIKIATIYSIGLHALQPIIRKFLKKYPDVNIHLEYAQNQNIYEMITNNKIDFGFVAYPKKTTGITAQTFNEDHLVIVQSPEYPIFNKKHISINDINNKKFISFSSEVPTGKSINHFLSKNKISPRLIHMYENIETLKSAISIGMGFSIVPKSTIENELKEKNLEIIHLKELNITRPLGILHISGKNFTKSMQSFYDLILKQQKGRS